MRNLENRVAIVTGSSSGIGRAIALDLAQRGAHIACVTFKGHEEAADEVAEELKRLGSRTHVYEVDVANSAEVRQLVDDSFQKLGEIDILVNNAGIEKQAPLLEIQEQDWDRVLQVNLKGAFLCLQATARHMVERGRGGRIINVSSVHEDLPFPGYIPYACSKGGMRMLTRTAALELAPKGITVVGVAPGAIATPINEKTLADPEKRGQLERMIPLGRIGQPEDVAHLVAWLASDEASYVTGTTFFVDGGLTQNAAAL